MAGNIKGLSNWFSKEIGREQSRDTGLALVLILLLAGYFSGTLLFYQAAIPVVLITLIIPGWFYPLAVFWFGLSHLMGSLISQFLLGLIFFLLVVPVALLRRMTGSDNLRLRAFRKGNATVMHVRNHRFGPSDFEKPF